ncbi:solute carrier family 22 member 6-A-like [Candoia aspera]|uniref:solute carrier family 22 member 6-A-like n=1 Tax=Candoia aspera TaxID=51853 RepID=UPI002FD7AAD9
MTFAQLLDRAGGMGCFQVTNVVLLCFPMLLMAAHNLLQNFTAAVPGHRCRVALNNECADGNTTGNPDCASLLKVFIPQDRDWLPQKCWRFVTPQWQLLEFNSTGQEPAEAEQEPCLDGWTYEGQVFTSTIVTEWDLVCDFRSLQQLAQSIYMAGVLVGAIIFGGLSDKFGRKALLLWSCFQMAVSGSCTAFIPSFTAYCVFRFLTGMAVSGVGLNCVSLSVEWTPMRFRAMVSMVTGYSYSIGQFLLAGVAYAIRDWRWLQLAVSVPYFAFFLYGWWFTESARWYATAGKLDQALKELQKVARMNGQKDCQEQLSLEVLKASLQKESPLAHAKFPVADLVRTPSLRRVTVCLCFVWFSTSFAYYGLAMDLQNFGVSIYLIQVIFGAVDIPAKLVAFLVICYLGRRITQALSLILAGLSIAGNIFVSHDMQILQTVFAVFGKGCLGASFNCVFLYTGELYPTVIRQTGMGLGNTMARVGGIVAPLVKMTSEYSPSLPLFIYAMAPIISGMAACFLPETLDAPLPDTVEDVESRNMEKQKRKSHRKDEVCHRGTVLLDMRQIGEVEKDSRLPENTENRDTGGTEMEACSDIPQGAITISSVL